MDKIDFVLPWVDGNDPTWKASKDRFYQGKSGKGEVSNDMRYRDWGTLKYVLRSIESNCPWYNKIFIITTGHYPKWLDIKHEKIVLVKHEDIYFDKAHLPTFNSSSIEMNLANIKDLSEKFIYLNDDMLILKKANISRFFVKNKPVDFFSHGWLPRNIVFEALRGMNSWSYSIKNNIELINSMFDSVNIDKSKLYHSSYGIKSKVSNFLCARLYKKIIWLEHWHHPQPYLKKTLTDVYTAFNKEMMTSSSNKFRKNNDLTQYIYRYWQLANNNFSPYKYNDGKVCVIQNRKDIDSCLTQLEKYTFFCPNDSIPNGTTLDELKYIESRLINKLEELLPSQASFEIKL